MSSTILHPTLLDPQTHLPLAALGVFRGRPIWPALGAEDPDPAKQDPPPDPDKPVSMTQAELDALIGRRVNSVKAGYADYDELKAKAEAHDKAQADAASELDKAKATAKAEGNAEATARLNVRVVKAEAKVQAGLLAFQNPAVAVGLLDLSKVKVDADGEPDSAAVKALLEDLAAKEPYLVKPKDDGNPRRPRPNSGQGNQSADKPTGREAGQAEADRRFGTKKS